MSAAENFRAILTEIEQARKREEIILVAVTKNHGVEKMQEVIDAGAKHIGENRVQEAAEKFQTLNREVTRHLIGHLQTNKVKYIIDKVTLIHSVDSVSLAAQSSRPLGSSCLRLSSSISQGTVRQQMRSARSLRTAMRAARRS